MTHSELIKTDLVQTGRTVQHSNTFLCKKMIRELNMIWFWLSYIMYKKYTAYYVLKDGIFWFCSKYDSFDAQLAKDGTTQVKRTRMNINVSKYNFEQEEIWMIRVKNNLR